MEITLKDYQEVVGPGVIEELRVLAERVRDRRMQHINSTSVGGGVAEILGGCEGGILVRPGDPAALAGALTDLLAENPAQRGRRSEAAWRRARAYDARIEAIRLARCYRAVAAGRVTVA